MPDPNVKLRYLTTKELNSFLKHQDPNLGDDDPAPPATIAASVSSHTPWDINKLPADDLIEYSPTPDGKFNVRLYAEPVAGENDKWIAKLKFTGDWEPRLVPILEKMELLYEEATHSLVAHDITVISGKLKLDTYKVHLIRGSDDKQDQWGFRDMLTWEFIEQGHPLYHKFIVTAYVWCVH